MCLQTSAAESSRGLNVHVLAFNVNSSIITACSQTDLDLNRSTSSSTDQLVIPCSFDVKVWCQRLLATVREVAADVGY